MSISGSQAAAARHSDRSREYKCVFFDLDHTLWDYECNAREMLAELHEAHKLGDRGISFEDFHRSFSQVNFELWQLYDNGLINNDVIRMVEAGVAEPAEIDRAIKGALGYVMGPLELLDLVGLDTHLLVAEALYAGTHEPRNQVPALVKRMIAAGHLGRKSGQGFYRYSGNAMFGG